MLGLNFLNTACGKPDNSSEEEKKGGDKEQEDKNDENDYDLFVLNTE